MKVKKSDESPQEADAAVAAAIGTVVADTEDKSIIFVNNIAAQRGSHGSIRRAVLGADADDCVSLYRVGMPLLVAGSMFQAYTGASMGDVAINGHLNVLTQAHNVDS